MNIRTHRTRVAALPALLLTTTALAGTITWDAGGDGSSWHDPSNWSGNVMPGPGDDAVIGAAATVIVSALTGDELVDSVDCDGTLRITGGSLTIAGASTVETLEMTTGALLGAGDVTVNGLFDWSGGTVAGTGTMFANGGIEMSFTTNVLGRRLESSGTTTWTGGQLRIDPDGRFVNLPGALFDEQGNDLMWFNTGSPGTFENRGTFRKSAGDLTTDIRVSFENTGTVEVLNGRVFIHEPYTQTAGATRVDTELEFEFDDQLDLLGGDLLGVGLVDGFVNNEGGTIRPGTSPGVLSVEGDVDMSTTAALIVELGGTKTGEFDVLAIDGDAFLGGLLEIRTFEGYIPPVGEFFTILTTTGSRIDIFDVTACEDFFLIDYLDQGVRLEVLAELSPADLNQDCSVGFADLQILLQSWGPCDPPPPAFCLGDINKDGGVGFADLQFLLQVWG